ncbi:MAG TPA: FIST N-terminal domain-containing protein [Thermoleophilaceae bacterium]|nr:FIST N-terminal domain-containing protein [Thermoleophilaceae bacterium]
MSGSVRCAVGIAASDAGADSFAEAAARAALGLGGAPADAVIVFAGAPNLAHAEEGLAAVAERLHPRAMVGCGAQGVVGEGREVELGGVAVWAASLGSGTAEAFALQAEGAGQGALAVSGVPDLDHVDALVLLVDPFAFPVEPLLAALADDHPGLPVVGGLASARGEAGVLLGQDGAVAAGAVGLALSGVRVAACVSQGAKPVGPEMAITAAEGNVIHELAGRPALERLQQALATLAEDERALALSGLLLGLVVDPNKPEYERGDFLVRGVLAADPASGSVTVGERVHVGQAVRIQVRDADSADEDLRAAVAEGVAALGGPPAGALIFTCNGRGSHMFSAPHHDAAIVDALAGAPAAGFFCAGEIGPVGARNFVHGFTATLALLAPAVE